MSDNPTLTFRGWWGDEDEQERADIGGPWIDFVLLAHSNEIGESRPASRADLLAALDVEWWCAEYEGGWAPKACTSPDEAKGWEHGGCHWAVKP